MVIGASPNNPDHVSGKPWCESLRELVAILLGEGLSKLPKDGVHDAWL